MSEWNWSAERRTAIGDVANQSLEYAAERLLESRKRAFDAEHKAQQLQAELDALKAAHNWIKTSERMPEPETVVLIVCTHDFADGEICTAKCYLSVRGSLVWEYYDTETGEAGKDIADKWVPCWMPLPDMPEALK